jgi:hypothetical protein
MEFRVADFEILSFHSKVYQDGLKKIDERKEGENPLISYPFAKSQNILD